METNSPKLGVQIPCEIWQRFKNVPPCGMVIELRLRNGQIKKPLVVTEDGTIIAQLDNKRGEFAERLDFSSDEIEAVREGRGLLARLGLTRWISRR